MGLSGKLAKWQSAGLIAPDQVIAITEFEREGNAKKFWRGITGAALTAFLLGLSLFVAAGWDDIPDWLKLAGHGCINLGLAYWIYQWVLKPNEPHKFSDAPVYLLWGATLTFLALIGKTYQLQGEAIDLVRFWFWLTAPFIILLARSPNILVGWAVVAFGMLNFEIIRLFDVFEDQVLNSVVDDKSFASKFQLYNTVEYVVLCVPTLCLLRACFTESLIKLKPALWRGLLNAGMFASLATISWLGFTDSFIPYVLDDVDIYAPVTVLLFCGILWFLSPKQREIPLFQIMLLAISASQVMVLTTFPYGILLSYITIWLGIGIIAYQANLAWLARLALAAIGLRLVVAFVDLFSSMFLSAFGFFFLGALLLCVVKVGRKLDARLTAALQARQTEPKQ